MPDTRQLIREQITSEFMPGRPADDLTDETDLIEQEIIDSLGIFLLVGFIQDRLEVEIQPEDVTLENFQTVVAIARLVETKRSLAAS